jgi:hypothetical protein
MSVEDRGARLLAEVKEEGLADVSFGLHFPLRLLRPQSNNL